MKPSKLNLFHVYIYKCLGFGTIKGNNRIDGCDGTNNEHFNRATPCNFQDPFIVAPATKFHPVAFVHFQPFPTMHLSGKQRQRQENTFSVLAVLKTINNTDLAIRFSWMQ